MMWQLIQVRHIVIHTIQVFSIDAGKANVPLGFLIYAIIDTENYAKLFKIRDYSRSIHKRRRSWRARTSAYMQCVCPHWVIEQWDDVTVGRYIYPKIRKSIRLVKMVDLVAAVFSISHTWQWHVYWLQLGVSYLVRIWEIDMTMFISLLFSALNTKMCDCGCAVNSLGTVIVVKGAKRNGTEILDKYSLLMVDLSLSWDEWIPDCCVARFSYWSVIRETWFMD